MGGIASSCKDDGKLINGILAAENAANRPNYLAILNVDKSCQAEWNEVKVFY